MRATESGRIESIHVMRGIAAFFVMTYHFTYTNDNFREKMPTLSWFFSDGGSGIWVFFVISGFVIPYAMAGMRYRFPRDAWPFFLRRVIRLEPPYVISVFFALAVAFAATWTPGYRGDPVKLDVLTLVSQFFYLAPWFGKPWINGIAWTLALEFQYYILMLFIGPLLLSGSKWQQRGLLLAAGIASFITAFPNALFSMLSLFAIGFITFLRYQKRMSTFEFLLFLAFFGAINWIVLDITAMIYGVVTAAAIFLRIPARLPVLSFLGSISYSLYLVHVPVGDRIINLVARLPGNFVIQTAGLACAIAASLGTAYLLWLFAENPSRELARSIELARRNKQPRILDAVAQSRDQHG